jgi:hypothetical protein
MGQDESAPDVRLDLFRLVLARRHSCHAKVEACGLLLDVVLASSLTDEVNMERTVLLVSPVVATLE